MLELLTICSYTVQIDIVAPKSITIQIIDQDVCYVCLLACFNGLWYVYLRCCGVVVMGDALVLRHMLLIVCTIISPSNAIEERIIAVV